MSKPMWYGAGLFVVVLTILFFWWQGQGIDIGSLVTAEVSSGTVSQLVSVSGYVEADNTANLSFPAAGRVSEIFVEEGEEVFAGTLLATLAQNRLTAERKVAQANLTKAEAARSELINGQTIEERAVTDATIAQAKSAWEQTVSTELQKVQNALISLRSNGLVAYPSDFEENAEPPTVSGSYLCAEEGEYTLEVYRSDSNSGFSIRYRGLESGVIPLTFDNPATIGDCGVEVQFTEGDSYENSNWTISIPNARSTSYLTYLNSLTLAEQQATQNIQAAREVLNLAESAADKDTAAPRIESLLSANASVAAAQSELARIDALLADQSIFAPFEGIVTSIDKLPGEIATTEAFITLLASDAFTLVARIPEIDITKVLVGQNITATFDAKTDEPLQGTIEFINPIATEIDGVAYFETKISLPEKPEWLRSGLNTDIDIDTAKKEDVLKIPQRFIQTGTDGNFITILNKNNKLENAPVELGLYGTDGMVEVTNLAEGTMVVAP